MRNFSLAVSVSVLHQPAPDSIFVLMRAYQNFIGGEWVSSASGKTYTNVNPADTREKVAEYPASGGDEARQAITAAQNAFSGWSRMTAVARGRVLSKASQILE